ncbi:MAG TPA: NADH-quinone oxidoreductase subunit H [Myxococcota bacterium]|nr:NADH-quinone oxidoreductase subunit H [Myxococcota bacterium]
MIISAIQVLLALLLAPALLSIIRIVKAFFGGRHGPTLLQPYRDLWKLARKAPVYSRTTSWVFRASPSVTLGAVLAALAVLPLCGVPGPLAFTGDFIFLAYAFGLVRFFTVAAALDTGSPFEGMGASREVQFSALAEVALFACLIALAILSSSMSLSTMLDHSWAAAGNMRGEGVLILVAAALMLVLLAENARIPVDDPTTHLELTMIHEVMILDHCGLDLAMIEYASALKLWIWSAIVISVALPMRTGDAAFDIVAGVCGVFVIGILIGVIESIMARLKLLKVPQLLVVAMVLGLLAVGLGLR